MSRKPTDDSAQVYGASERILSPLNDVSIVQPVTRRGEIRHREWNTDRDSSALRMVAW